MSARAESRVTRPPGRADNLILNPSAVWESAPFPFPRDCPERWRQIYGACRRRQARVPLQPGSLRGDPPPSSRHRATESDPAGELTTHHKSPRPNVSATAARRPGRNDTDIRRGLHRNPNQPTAGRRCPAGRGARRAPNQTWPPRLPLGGPINQIGILRPAGRRWRRRGGDVFGAPLAAAP